MRISSAGNVGIGESSPSGLLHLKKASDTADIILESSGGSGKEYLIGSRTDGSLNFYDVTASNERMRIDSSGNVGIGTNSPNGNGILTLNTPADNSAQIVFAENDTAKWLIGHRHDGDYFRFYDLANSAERMRIDSSGNLLVGKTVTAFGTQGIVLNSNGSLDITKSGDAGLFLNRLGSDGVIQYFYKDGTAVGSIGVNGGDLYIENGITGISFNNANNALLPTTTGGVVDDANQDLGISSHRFRNLYRSGSTISTSDRNMKQDIRDLTDAERNVAVAAKGLLKAFRFIDRVEEEGDSANIHFGIIAQDLAAAFTAEGLDAKDYQVYRADTFTDDDGNEQTRLGICYENLLAFIISAI